MNDSMGFYLLIGIDMTCCYVHTIALQCQWGILLVINWHWIKMYPLWWMSDLRGQFLMLEWCKYLFQAQVHNLVAILYYIYCYIHKILQMNNIWVSWCVGPNISLQLCCLYNPRRIILMFFSINFYDMMWWDIYHIKMF